MTPPRDFAAVTAPDHGEARAWTYRDEQRGGEGDPLVFYVHPTTAAGPGWFADPRDPEVASAVRRVTDEHLVAFPGRVWAPRYRQATTRAFHERAGGGTAAYDLAYDDVAAAFANFLAEDAALGGPPRPIVLAGHSQGARHVLSLLAEFFDHPGLAARLVAVYAIGIPVPTGTPMLDRFPPATDPTAAGVVIGFDTTPAAASAAAVCVNPLTFAVDRPDSDSSAHLPADRTTRPDLADIRVATRVRGASLEVLPDTAGALDAVALPGGGLHRVEVQLFSGNLAADLRRRTQTWRRGAESAHATPTGPADPAERDVPVPCWPGVLGHRVRVRDGWMHYVDLCPEGGVDPAAVPVVLLHKLGGWAADWRHVAEALAARRRVVVVDLPGHGGSIREDAAPWAHSPRVSADLVRDLLDRLGVGPAHLMGSSLGGIVALLVTAADPARVRSLTLVGVSLTERHSPARTLANDRAVRPGFGPGWMPIPGAGATRAATDDANVLREQDESRTCAGQWVRPSERGVGLMGVAHLLPDIPVPVLVVNGARAGYRAYEDTARTLLANVRIGTVPEAGSFPHQERPRVVADLWASFVAGL